MKERLLLTLSFLNFPRHGGGVWRDLRKNGVTSHEEENVSTPSGEANFTVSLW